MASSIVFLVDTIMWDPFALLPKPEFCRRWDMVAGGGRKQSSKQASKEQRRQTGRFVDRYEVLRIFYSQRDNRMNGDVSSLSFLGILVSDWSHRNLELSLEDSLSGQRILM
mmetsp:Transcript_19965/g.46636  ORF Transcript_19965/g.46636 Transcript_19965/m.46636 type:complete len:111 (+) Transcript_19965:598-930(+)